MKYFIIILSFFLSTICYSQTFINRAGPANTVQDDKLAAKNAFYLPRLNDTAFVSGALDSIGLLIYDRLRAKVWIRDTVLTGGHKWSDIGSNIANASLVANGTYAQNWNNKQLWIDSISSAFQIRSGGIGTTGTRRKEFKIAWGTSFADNLDGWRIVSVIRNVASTTDSIYAGMVSSGNGVLSAGIFNTALGSNFISYNTGGLININAKDSIWIKGAVVAATADSILGIEDRGNGLGKLKKIPYTQTSLSNTGSDYRWVATSNGQIKTVSASNTILWDSTSNSNALTANADTSVLATQYDLTQITPTLIATQIAFGSPTNTITSEAAFNYISATNKLTVDSLRLIKEIADSIMMGSYESDVTDSSTFFGTSITGGTNAIPITTNRYSAITASGLRAIEVNKGLGGYLLQKTPTWPLANTFKEFYPLYIQPKSARSRYLFFAWGENDAYNEYLYGATFGVDTGYFKRDYGIVINYAVSLGWSLSDIRIISPFYQLTSRCPLNIQQKYYDAALHFADSMGIQFIDVFTFGKNYNSLILSDDIHPSNYGHALYAYTILKGVNQPLQAKTGESFINSNTVLLNNVKFFGKDTATAGYGLAAVNSDGTLTKVPSERYLLLDNTNVPVQSGNASVLGSITAGHAIRAGTQTAFTSGTGLEIYYSDPNGFIVPINRNTSSFGNVIMPFSKLIVGNSTPTNPFSTLFVYGTGSAHGLFSSGSGNVLYNSSENLTTLNMLVSGDTVGYITTYSAAGYKPTSINGASTNPVLINTFSNNGIGALQVNGKITVATVDSSSNPANIVWQDPLTKEFKKAAIPSAASQIHDSLTANGISYGTYTPTLTNSSNISGSTAYQCQWMRVGNVVTVSGKVDIDPTTATTLTILGISLPVASEIGNDFEAGGAAAAAIPDNSGSIKADATNNRAQLDFTSGTDVANRSWFFSFTYLITPP